jgi:hypothetical protein
MNDSIFRNNITADTNEVLLHVNANMTEDSYNYSYNRLEEQVIFFGISSLGHLNEAAFYILLYLDLPVNDKVLRLSVMEKMYDLLINKHAISKVITKDYLISLFTSNYIGKLLELARYRECIGLTDKTYEAFKQPFIQYENKVGYVSSYRIEERFKDLDKYMEQL